MALTESIEYDKIEVVGTYKAVQVRKATVIKKDGVEIPGSRSFERYILQPGELDASDNLVDNPLDKEPDGVTAIADEVKSATGIVDKSTTCKDCSLTNSSKIFSSSVIFNSKTASSWDFSPSADAFFISIKSFPEIISWSIRILIKFISDSLLISIITKFLEL